MKKLVAMLLLLACFVLAFASCGADGGNSRIAVEPESASPVADANGGTAADGVNGEGKSGGSTADYGDATVFAKGMDVWIILTDTSVENDFSKFISGLENGGVNVKFGNQYMMDQEHEIVVGNIPDKAIAEKAYKLLSRMDKESYFKCNWLIYAEGGSLAIAYDENAFTSLTPLAEIGEELAKKLGDKPYFASGKGIVAYGMVDLLEKQEELDDLMVQQQWIDLAAASSQEIADAAKVLYGLYGDDMPLWIANLYDPGVGGFYASSSGRDYYATGPDVQCTVQLFRFIVSSGMVDEVIHDGDWTSFIPEAMQQQMIYFAKSLQIGGYFYHPQWGKELTDKHLSRRGRDLGWATDLLSCLHSAPEFDTANGKKGDGISADEYWDALEAAGLALSSRPYPSTESPTEDSIKKSKSNLTTSVATSVAAAVSKVILMANPEDVEIDASTAYLKSYTSFIDYLLVTMGPGMDSNPYSMGNNLNATYSQIATSDKELGNYIDHDNNPNTDAVPTTPYVYTEGDEATSTNAAVALAQFKVNCDDDTTNDITLQDIYKSFEGMTLKQMTIYALNEKIDPEIGLWGKKSEKNPTGTEFLFTNGFFKVISLYNSWKVNYPIEYMDEVANALMTGLVGDQPSTTNICEVYNVWSAICSLRSNLKYVDDPEVKAEVTAIMEATLSTKAAAAITNTYNKILGYKKLDGGFKHSYAGTGTSHQGLQVSLPINQSDVDATCIGTTGMTRAMFEALGLSSYKPNIYTTSDWMRMVEIFVEQQPVIKYSYDAKVAVDKVHDYETGLPDTNYLKPNGVSATNQFLEAKDGDNNIALMSKFDSIQLYLDLKVNASNSASNVAIFETDLLFDEIAAANEAIELRFYAGTSASATRIYVLYIKLDGKTDGSKIYAYPKSDSSKRIEIGEVGKWLTLSLTYWQKTDTSEPVFKVYANGAAEPIVVDQKFENAADVNAIGVGFARFLTMSAFRGKIYLDNTRFVHEVQDFVAHEPTHNVTTKPSTPSTPTTPEGSNVTTVDGTINFDGATSFPINADNGVVVSNNSQSAWGGSVNMSSDGEGATLNNFIRVNDPYDSNTGDKGQCIFLIDRPAYTGTDTTFVFEGKFRISPLADGTIKNGPNVFDITFRNDAGTRVYRTYFGDGAIGLNQTTGQATGLYKESEWFSIRVEYTVVGADAASATWDVKCYINGELTVTSTDATKNTFCDSVSIDKVGILLSKDFVGLFDVDDIKVYQKAAQ